MEKAFRSRNMGLLLYPEDPSHEKAIELIKVYDYAMILHDKDIDEDGVIKKAHHHVVLRAKNAIWQTALAKELGITPNYIQQIRNEEAALEYLIHFNEEDKHQYDIECVKGPLKRKLIEYVNKDGKSEGEKVQELIDYIESQKKVITITEFASYCAKSGYWDVFRRSAGIYTNIIREHNQEYHDESRKNITQYDSE